MGNLTATKVRKLAKPGRHGDGGGLYLLVSKGGSKSWIQRIRLDGKRTDKGLGGFPKVTLTEARRVADRNRVAVADGRDPFTNQAKTREVFMEHASTVPTFAEVAQMVHQNEAGQWKSSKYAERWLGTLNVHVLPTLGDVPIDKIKRADLREVMKPVCLTRPETARKLLQRLRKIFAWAVDDYIETNPVDDALTGKLPKVRRRIQHFPSMPYQDVPAFVEGLRHKQSLREVKLALEFVVLTGCRSGEVRGATWDEIDMDDAIWTIPESRMKAGREHRVPLSFQARTLLDEARAAVAKRRKRRPDYNPAGNLIFPHPSGRQLSENALQLTMKRDGRGFTVHGFRSSFRNWAQEQSGASWAAVELSLAHKAGTTVEQAYFRSDLLDQRLDLMQQWSDFVDPMPF